MTEAVPPVPGMKGVYPPRALRGRPVVGLFLVAEPSFYLIGGEIISMDTLSVPLSKTKLH